MTIPHIVVERFWNKVRKTDSCWLWIGATDRRGHGQIRSVLIGGQVYAHRLSWLIHRGEIPEGINVCHNCPGGDNASCVNPDHLFLGTQAANLADMAEKGRSTWGPRNSQCRLTTEQIDEIKKSDLSHQKVADLYGVSRRHIKKIRSGQRRSKG